MSNSLLPHGLQHAGPPYPSPTPRASSNSYPLSRWCHPTITSSVVPFSSCLQSFPASGSFPMSQLLSSWGQSIGASASASVLSVNIQGWFPLGLTGLISSQSKGLSRIFYSTTIWKHQSFSTVFLMGQPSHRYMTTGKTIALTTWNLVSKMMSLESNYLGSNPGSTSDWVATLPSFSHLLNASTKSIQNIDLLRGINDHSWYSF